MKVGAVPKMLWRLSGRWPRIVRLCGGVAVAIAAVALIWRSWLGWNDPQIDFGRELYLPWRVLEGEHPGANYLHPYGPLSVYLNAAAMSLGGISVRTPVLLNLLFFSILCAFLYVVLRRAYGFLPAILATLIGVVVFGFPHYAGINNYTYALPYSHEATHGMVLLLGFLGWLGRPRSAPARVGDALVCGFWMGACSLTKSEYVLTASVLGLCWLVRSAHEPSDRNRWWRLGAAQVTGVAIVLAAAAGALTFVMPPVTALGLAANAVLAPFLLADYSQSAHVLRFLGADNLAFNLHFVARAGGFALAVLLMLSLAGRGLARARDRRVQWAGAGLILVVASWGTSRVDWLYCASAFPLLLLGALGYLGWQRRTTPAPVRRFSERQWNQFLALVAAAAMLARMAFDPTISHYGFFQALLAGTTICAWLFGVWGPSAFPGRLGRAGLMTGLAIFLGGGAVQLVGHSQRFYRAKQTEIGTGADRILGYAPAVYALPEWWEQARRFIADNTRDDSTLLVIPEGLSLNYWTRRRHPLRIADLLPATLRLHGRDVVGELASRPPDTVVLVSRPNLEELGITSYGADATSGKGIVDWVHAHYQMAAQAGGDPLASGSVGLQIWQRRPSQPAGVRDEAANRGTGDGRGRGQP